MGTFSKREQKIIDRLKDSGHSLNVVPDDALFKFTVSCVRQNCVVLAPVAGVKSAEFCPTLPGSAKHQSADDGDKNEFVAGESTA
jgi:hypothetical protein